MDAVLNYTFDILKYKPDKYEILQYHNFLNNPVDLHLITEKNIIKNSQEDNYNFGNYFNLKEKDSMVSNIFFTNEFLAKYASTNEKKYLDYLKDSKISLDHINKFLIIYNNIKFNKLKKNFNIKNDINNYIFN